MPALMLNGVNYSGAGGGGNANEQVLTWAEYCALTPEEKMNDTTYYINDINGDEQSFQPVIFSLEEREIGVWIDGKPLYQKTIHTGAMTTDTSWHTIPHNIENMETPVSAYGYIKSGSVGYWYPIPQFRANTSMGITLELTLTSINYIQYWLSSAADSYVTIQYTKTTDQPGSGTWTPQGVPAVHYDGNEKVVGTWFGETLYEKTVAIPTGSISSTNYHTICSADGLNIISFVGFIIENTREYILPDPGCRVCRDTSNNLALYCTSGSSWVISGGYVTIRYTKTTS